MKQMLTSLQTPRKEWVLEWPGQVVIAGCQIFWTTEVSEALEKGELPTLYEHLLKQVNILTKMSDAKLTQCGLVTPYYGVTRPQWINLSLIQFSF